MTKFEDDRKAADARYTQARRAVAAMATDLDPAARQKLIDEHVAAHNEALKFARQAGSETLREGETTI